ncbi:hypothetical protein KAR91_54550 [Candidatus Pacearchaeota archaeon]|nr:hypothetical protein [Candidatus Pacearchaeota archaeon]
MTAIANNLTQALTLDAVTMTSAAVGGAQHGFPVVNNSFPKGIDGTTNCQQLNNDNNALVANDHYSAWASFGGASYDLQTVQQAFFMHFKNNSPGFNSIAENSDSLRMILFSGGGTTNYARWHYNPQNAKDGAFYPVGMFGTPDATGGTFDDGDVTGWGISVEAANTDVFGFQISVDQLVYINGPVIFEDTGPAATVDLIDYFDLLKATSGTTYHSLLVTRAGPGVEFGFPFEYRSDDYSNSRISESTSFKEPDGALFVTMPAGYYQQLYTPPANSTLVFRNAAMATNSTDYDLTIDASASSCDLDFISCLFAGVDDVVLSGSGVSMTGCTIASPETCSLADGDLDLTVNDCTVAVVIDNPLASGSSLTITDPQATALEFAVEPQDLSAAAYTVPANSTVNMAGTSAGTYILTSMTSTGQVTFTSSDTSAITITVDPALNAVTSDPNITINNPDVTNTLQTSGLIANSRLEVRNVTKGTYLVQAQQPLGDWSITYTQGVEADNGDELRIRTALHVVNAGGAQFKEPTETTVIVSGDTTIPINQVDWEAANQMSAESPIISDGASLTEFSLDGSNLQIDVNDPDGTSEFRRMSLWYAYQLWFSLEGMQDFFGALSFLDEANIRVNRSIIGLQIENTNTSTALRFSDGLTRRFYTDDGSDIIAPSSAGRSIQIEQGTIAIGGQDKITDVLIAMDLETGTPNTYRNDKTSVTNSKFTLTRAPAGGDAFTVVRTET